LIREELARLDALEAGIRLRDADEPEEMEGRLQALEKMRERLSSAHGG
jgi:hypothetical protein